LCVAHFFENSHVRLYESDSYQDIQHLLHESVGEIPLIFDSAVSDFVGNKVAGFIRPRYFTLCDTPSEWTFKAIFS
jgi:hypothetical protein